MMDDLVYTMRFLPRIIRARTKNEKSRRPFLRAATKNCDARARIFRAFLPPATEAQEPVDPEDLALADGIALAARKFLFRDTFVRKMAIIATIIVERRCALCIFFFFFLRTMSAPNLQKIFTSARLYSA